MHHGTCVTHLPSCMSGSLTCGGGENFPEIPGACAPAILRIWQEAHWKYSEPRQHCIYWCPSNYRCYIASRHSFNSSPLTTTIYVTNQVYRSMNDCMQSLLLRWRHSKWSTRFFKILRHFAYISNIAIQISLPMFLKEISNLLLKYYSFLNICNPFLFISASILSIHGLKSWRRHQMEIFSTLLDLCARNSPVSGEFPVRGALMSSLICA